VGIFDGFNDFDANVNYGDADGGQNYYLSTGQISGPSEGSPTSAASWTTGDILGIVVIYTGFSQEARFFKNGVAQAFSMNMLSYINSAFMAGFVV
jgi:hypothetical protein